MELEIFKVKIEVKKQCGFKFIEEYYYSNKEKALKFLKHYPNFSEIELSNLSNEEIGTHYFGVGYNTDGDWSSLYITSEKVY